MARRKFTREFKVSAVKLVNDQGYSPAEAARSLGVDPASVRGWVAKLGAEAGVVPTGEWALAAELRRLRKENAQRRVERETLKKAPGGRPSSRRSSHDPPEIRLHPRAPRGVAGGRDVPRAGGVAQRLLRVAAPHARRPAAAA